MKALILDGFPLDHPRGDWTRRSVTKALRDADVSVEVSPLGALDIGSCDGCFRCWHTNPGECARDDDMRQLARHAITADVLVLLTPIGFAGYGWRLKMAVERLIGLLHPFFERVAGETHHEARYDSFPALLAVGFLPAQERAGESSRLFRAMVTRNAINFRARAHRCVVLPEAESGWWGMDLVSAVRDIVDVVERGKWADPGRDEAEAALAEARSIARLRPVDGLPPERALLLVGSPRIGRSTSLALGEHLMRALSREGVKDGVLDLRRALARAEFDDTLKAALAQADLVVLAAPVYMDGLPGATVLALERIAAERSGTYGARGSLSPHLVVLLNTGFPESAQSAVAAAACRLFARGAGLGWQGALSLGGGAAIDGLPLHVAGRIADHPRRALDLAAASLAAGQPVPAEAVALMARPIMPMRVYSMMANRRFKKQARENGVLDRLDARPYAEAPVMD